jgi:hypothetical protein
MNIDTTGSDRGRRCTPGRKTIDRACDWHTEHYWCTACEGFYGVPHAYAYAGHPEVHTCHTGRALAGHDIGRADQWCACRYCDVVRADGWQAAETRFAKREAGR